MDNKIKRSILIIDDDPAIRKVIIYQLRSLEYGIFEASSMNEALAVLEAEKVAAVLCDVKLKEESGFDIVREIITKYPNLPVVMLTGFIEQEFYQTSIDMGCRDLIIKPVRKEKLQEVLEKVFRCSER
jgi:DNA-binding NtrC family response regulator